MSQKIKEKPEQNEVSDECNHFWQIEAANGPKSQGVCKHCGKSKEFLNAFPDFNPMKRKSSPLELPELPEVEVDEDSKS